MRHNHVPYTIAHDRAQVYVYSELVHGLSPSSVYTHIKYMHKNVIITSYISHRCSLTEYYVSTKNIMNSQEKKVDISAYLYVLIIFIAFVIGISL